MQVLRVESPLSLNVAGQSKPQQGNLIYILLAITLLKHIHKGITHSIDSSSIWPFSCMES